MISVFLREQKRYTQIELCELLECSEEKIIGIIKKLKEYGVLKTVKASDKQKDLTDLFDADVEIVDVESGDTEFFYVFTFVGVITVAGRVLKCYPKYLLHIDKPVSELKQVLQVLEKYCSREQIVRMFNNTDESQSFNLLAVMLFLMNDYFSNGVYSNTEEIIESNGSGEILWDKTINETFAFLSNDRPYYIDLQTKKRINNDYDYFKQLHECILTQASLEMKEADLLSLFDYTEVDITDKKLDDFGDKDYILYRIEKELNEQFSTRKQLVLKTMCAYIEKGGHLYDMDCLSMFGSNSFYKVWEDVCADILDNQLYTKLSAIKLPRKLSGNYDSRLKLIETIEKPRWSITGLCAEDTLIPDIVSIEETSFFIFDAKYYNTILEKNQQPKGQPGIESITKQYLYQLSYKKFISEHGFEVVRNCFLLPTEENSIIDKGEVSLKMLEDLDLENIKVRCIPASSAFEHYLSNTKMDISMLNL
ncbi:MAG: LlaJI family restriction endonuclease [Prevotellaceae bacterium]|nr:LlaJI family restriction endonuclease [Candidatus Faecinaster equi]